jgi:membrane dipeptidase
MAPADPRDDLQGWYRGLGVSPDAVALTQAADVVDLHVESFIWTRVFRYDLGRWHRPNLLGDRLFGQADVPRMRAAGLTGAVMSIATNPFRPARDRRAVCLRNVARLTAALERNGVDVVQDLRGYRRARQSGRFAAFLALQGANALSPEDLGAAPIRAVSRITLVHLTRSRLGAPSAAGGRGGGLTSEGRRFVEAMKDHRVIADLAHASHRTFWDAVDAHGRDRPLVVSHTGVRSERDSWRNLDDAQVRAVADTGGVVGIMLHNAFVAKPARRATAADVVRHIEHVVRVAGEDAVALGSDFDGFILPPRDVATVLHVPVLVQRMLDRDFSESLIRKVLGGNYLRVVDEVRPSQV